MARPAILSGDMEVEPLAIQAGSRMTNGVLRQKLSFKPERRMTGSGRVLPLRTP